MDSQFNPPKNKEEFLERAAKVETKAALSLRNALLNRRASMTRALDIELDFYDALIELREKGDVEWPRVGASK